MYLFNSQNKLLYIFILLFFHINSESRSETTLKRSCCVPKCTSIQNIQSGPTGATGPRGRKGPRGFKGSPGKIGPTGITGSKGNTGVTGIAATGATGFSGNTGSTGLRGTTGATGIGGVLGYGYFYNLTAQVVAVEGAISFDNTGPVLNLLHIAGNAAINIINTGVYAITFSVSGAESNQFAIFVNGVANTTTIYGSGAITQQNTGQTIIQLTAGDIVTIVNHTSATPITLATTIGGTQASVNASILIVQLA
ncbi:MAG: collagen-like protein [Candidatus Babeliales bacterium]|nr:collagen-like protein [Candidatus Babeliales bacterium]